MLFQGAVGAPSPGRGVWATQRRELTRTQLGRAHLGELDDDKLIEVIVSYERMAAWAAGRQLAAMAAFARRRRGAEREFAANEIAPAAALTPRTADARLDLAEDLDTRLPAVLHAMDRGELSLAKAAIIAGATSVLDDDTARYVVAQLLDDAAGWTTGQLRHQLAKAVLRADPDAANRRAEAAKQERGVWLRRGEDGNACLDAVLDAHDGAAAFAVIDEAARAAKTPGDERSTGQRRAAAFIDLILGRQSARHALPASAAAPNPAVPNPAVPDPAAPDPAAEPASEPAASGSHTAAVTTIVNVMVPLRVVDDLLRSGAAATDPTEAGLCPGSGSSGSASAGWVEGVGPVPAATVRDLIRDLLGVGRAGAGRVGWRVVGCDDRTGAVHALGFTRYRPPRALAELVQLRDRTCRFPGCRRKATRCDVDHVRPWDQGGLTCECNLQSLCRHHHRLKQRPGWSVSVEDGIATWVSPTGRTYRDYPPDDLAP